MINLVQMLNLIHGSYFDVYLNDLLIIFDIRRLLLDGLLIPSR